MKTAGDLAADWSWMDEHTYFRVIGGRRLYTDANASTTLRTVKIGYIRHTQEGHLQSVIRYVDPDTPIELVQEESHE